MRKETGDREQGTVTRDRRQGTKGRRQGTGGQAYLTVYFQLDQGLIYLRVYFLDLVVCEGLSYNNRKRLTGCSWYLSTTTSSTATLSASTLSSYQGTSEEIKYCTITADF